MGRKLNKRMKFIRDNKKSYVYIKDGNNDIGILMWHYAKKKWVFKDNQKKKR